MHLTILLKGKFNIGTCSMLSTPTFISFLTLFASKLRHGTTSHLINDIPPRDLHQTNSRQEKVMQGRQGGKRWQETSGRAKPKCPFPYQSSTHYFFSNFTREHILQHGLESWHTHHPHKLYQAILLNKNKDIAYDLLVPWKPHRTDWRFTTFSCRYGDKRFSYIGQRHSRYGDKKLYLFNHDTNMSSISIPIVEINFCIAIPPAPCACRR